MPLYLQNGQAVREKASGLLVNICVWKKKELDSKHGPPGEQEEDRGEAWRNYRLERAYGKFEPCKLLTSQREIEGKDWKSRKRPPIFGD